MQSSFNAASLQLVYKETLNLFHKIEVEIETFIATEMGEHLTNIIEVISQIRGTMVIVGLPATAEILDDVKEAVEQLEFAEAGDKQKFLNVICHAISVLPRYLEFIQTKTDSLPYLLLPTINELRHQLNKNKIGLSYFFNVGARPKYPTKNWDKDHLEEFQREAPDIHKRFEEAMLDILAKGPTQDAMIQLQDAIRLIKDLCFGKPSAELWILSDLALEAFIEGSVKFTKPRRRLFAKIDRIFKALLKDSRNSYNLKVPDPIIKELLYIIGLTGADNTKYSVIKDRYQIPDMVIDEKGLLREYYNFKGPSATALATAFTGLQDDLSNLLGVITPTILKNGTNRETVETISESLLKIGKVLQYLKRPEGELIFKQIRLLSSVSPDQNEQTNTKVINAINLVLTQINMSLSKAIADPLSTRKSPLDAKISTAILTPAERESFTQARDSLRAARDGLSEFIATRDPSHVMEVPTGLKGAYATLVDMQIDAAPEILYACLDFVENGLMNANNTVTGKQLTILADAITGIDYYLECRLNNQPVPESLLERQSAKVSQITVTPA